MRNDPMINRLQFGVGSLPVRVTGIPDPVTLGKPDHVRALGLNCANSVIAEHEGGFMWLVDCSSNPPLGISRSGCAKLLPSMFRRS